MSKDLPLHIKAVWYGASVRMAPCSLKINLRETNVLTPRKQHSQDMGNRKEQAKDKNNRHLAGLTDPE